MTVTDADVVARHAGGPLADGPAVTRRAVGSGAAYYVSCALDPASLDEFVGQVLDDAGVEPAGGDDERRLVVQGVELVTGQTVDHEPVVPGREVRVVRESR